MAKRRIKVLVVEKSPGSSLPTAQLLAGDQQIDVFAVAANAAQALESLHHHRPDVVTVDAMLPGMGAFELTRRIMQSHPVPVVVVGASLHAADLAFMAESLQAGAVAAVGKPMGFRNEFAEAGVRQLVQTVKAMSEVKVVRRWSRANGKSSNATSPAKTSSDPRSIQLIAIGASTGGPPVLQTILRGLSPDLPVPVLIVQHLAPGFITGLAEWLSDTTDMPVRVAKDGEELRPGHVYLAPDGTEMGIRRKGSISLGAASSSFAPCPSVAHLFATVADSYESEAAGVLLTGMGRDGAEELRLLRDRGAVTFIQDRESSTVYGMPGEALELDAACYIMRPDEIASALVQAVNRGCVGELAG